MQIDAHPCGFLGRPVTGSAIVVRNVTKDYRIYQERNQTLKERVLRRRAGRFTTHPALRGVSFSVPAGATVGIIGPNGAGKSTLLKILAGILDPDGGSIEIKGRVAGLLELGSGFHPDLSGRENVFMNGAMLGLSRKFLRSKFDEIVEFSGLERSIDNAVKTYSSGMYARLGFAVAVNVDPDVLLLDEVLAVGDEEFQRRCGEKIAAFRTGGRTVVLVSHGLGQIQAMCDRAVWIDSGVVAAEGRSVDVISSYLRSLTQGGGVQAKPDAAEADASGRMIRSIEVLNSDGKSVSVLRCGDPCTVRVTFDPTGLLLEDVVVGFAIHRTDGAPVMGTNSRGTVFRSAPSGSLRVTDYKIDRLSLLPANYRFAVALTDKSLQVRHEWVEDAMHLAVVPGDDEVIYSGLVTMFGAWQECDEQ
jgi:ABC-type polysaccharide/polyol phosphate transport system ATPase subunit